MPDVTITPKHAAIKQYYARRDELAAQGVTHEMAVREAFKGLLEQAAHMQKWTLVVEQKIEGMAKTIRPDGTLRDGNTLPRGYWEAKDTRDDLYAEIEKKFGRGYPKTNIIFEDTRRAVLYQTGEKIGDYDLTQSEQVATLLTRFLNYTEPNIAGFEQAVERFKQDTPELARGLLNLIADAHKTNKAFQSAYSEFFALCQSALNPNISKPAVDEMLIQHLLTERLMRTVFDNPDFARRNAIAAEVERVIDALTSKSFSRKAFLGQLDYLYEAIEKAAQNLTGFTERQTFINTVYERFFQGYAVKVADTHGIVYTPQPIVDFMCAAVEEVLRDEFDLALSDDKVCIIDPCTGTGNFIINLLQRIHAQNPAALPAVYQNRLFANEVMLLPYYVASLNIEHAYYDLTRSYEPFEGLCFVDTLDLAEGAQKKLAFMTEKNTERVERQKKAPITVIIGNPPYNVGQVNENDNNKNRRYEVIDKRVRETYAKDSSATNKNALSDVYVKFFRWAADRLQGRDGVVCYVTNNSFVDQIAFDGMRKHLLGDFTRVYHLDLHGNVRQNPKLSGTTHNVFGIQVGVGITVAIRSSAHENHRVFYHRVPEFWRRDEKLAYLMQVTTPLPLQGEGHGVGSNTPQKEQEMASNTSQKEHGVASNTPQKEQEMASNMPQQKENPIPNPNPSPNTDTPPLVPPYMGGDSAPLPLQGEGHGVGSNTSQKEHGVGSKHKGWAVHHTNAHFYQKIKPLARQMRTEPTLAEKHLWKQLRHKQLGNYKFRRQHVIDRFIVDFYCAEARLVIEVDGPIHDYTQEEDALRQAFLESLGLRVLRFKNDDVLQEVGTVIAEIEAALNDGVADPTPTLPEHREGVTPPPMHGGIEGGISVHGGIEGGIVAHGGIEENDMLGTVFDPTPTLPEHGEGVTPPPMYGGTEGGISVHGGTEGGNIKKGTVLRDSVFGELLPDDKNTWLAADNADEFAALMPMGNKEGKATRGREPETIFKIYGRGVATSRDDVVYDFDRTTLIERVQTFIENYNSEVDRYRRAGSPANVDNFVKYDLIKWSRDLKLDLRRGNYAEYNDTKVRSSTYRPFVKRYVFFDRVLNEEVYVFPRIFPTPETEQENRIISCNGIGSEKPFFTYISKNILDLAFVGGGTAMQCFPFYIYDETPLPLQGEGQGVGSEMPQNRQEMGSNTPQKEHGVGSEMPQNRLGVGLETPQKEHGVGSNTPQKKQEVGSNTSQKEQGVGSNATNASPPSVPPNSGGNLRRRENITDWALAEFQHHYNDTSITKWDIFYYVYGLLHHPEYRTRYADSLKRELPRIPFVPLSASPLPEFGEGLGVGSETPQNRQGVGSQTPQEGLGVGSNTHHNQQQESGFRAFSIAGKALAELHLNYESITPYPLEYQWQKNKPISYYVEKMKLIKPKTPSPTLPHTTGKGDEVTYSLIVNPSLTLVGIPAAALEYKLGNRSALDWVIDQYRVKEDKRSGINSDPNQYSENEKYIVELIGRVVAVSLKTVEIVKGLPAFR